VGGGGGKGRGCKKRRKRALVVENWAQFFFLQYKRLGAVADIAAVKLVEYGKWEGMGEGGRG
jgi:hypothetical protein